MRERIPTTKMRYYERCWGMQIIFGGESVRLSAAGFVLRLVVIR